MWHNVRERFDARGRRQRRLGDELHGLRPTSDCAQGPVARQRLRRLGDVGPLPQEHLVDERIGAFYDHLTATSDAEHDFLSKPWGLAECGYTGTSRRRVRDVRRGAANIDNGVHPRLKAYVVWDN